MGRRYTAGLDNLSVTNDADQNIWALTAGSANKLVLISFELYSAATVAENLRLCLQRETTAAAGTGNTEAKLDEEDVVSTATLVTLDLTPGTLDKVLRGYQWEQLGPLIFQPVPEERPLVLASGIITLNLKTALGATTLMSGSVTWEEI